MSLRATYNSLLSTTSSIHLPKRVCGIYEGFTEAYLGVEVEGEKELFLFQKEKGRFDDLEIGI